MPAGSAIALPLAGRSVIADDAPKCTADPDESSTRSETERGSGAMWVPVK